ncbi:DUF4391 domain-containing protein [Weizmannia sp. FSL W8-0676]|nr:DUF4391 domain-containing protein [Heyndrickxia coagulans]MBF8418083.1 DUF4391 domain-containing protein [Heyndrickxia coagulans]
MDDRIVISSSMKRLNKTDKTKTVLLGIHKTPWFDPEAENDFESDFIQSIHLININFSNFYEAYKDLDRAVEAFQYANLIGRFQLIKNDEKQAKHKEKIQEIEKLDEKIHTLKSKIKKETQFNKKVKLNIHIQKLKQQLTKLKRELTK